MSDRNSTPRPHAERAPEGEVTAAVEPYLVEWATEVDDLGTKAIWDSEAEARAEAKHHGQRLFRIEWTEAEQPRPQDAAQAPQDGANGGDVGSGRGEGVSTPQRGAQAPEDREFIAHARTDVPRLAGLAERLLGLADEWEHAAIRRADITSDLFDATSADYYRSRAADLREAIEAALTTDTKEADRG